MPASSAASTVTSQPVVRPMVARSTGAPAGPGAATCRLICMLVFDGAQSLDICGPLEVFALASRQAQEDGDSASALYEVRIIARTAAAVRLAAGLQLLPDATCESCPDDTHTLLVSGGMGDALARARADRGLVRWLRGRGKHVARLGSICNGALLLADSGLLDGRRATTHWSDIAELRTRYPDVEVVEDAIYTRSGHVWTSAGVTAGIDLALAMVADDHGPALAAKVARRLVLASRRSGGQVQISAQLRELDLPDRFADLADWIGRNLKSRLDVASLAERVHLGSRHFTRRFRAMFGVAPRRYVELRRVEAAKALLEHSARDLKGIALDCGFSSEQTMCRSFVRHCGLPPHAYRLQFAAAD